MADWREELSKTIRSVDELARLGYVDRSKLPVLRKLAQRYPVSVTRYYLSLIKKKDFSDPIYRMCIVSEGEQLTEGSKDTSGELSNTVSSGIQHKYENTVLLLSTNQCAMYCRHCFRKRLVGQSEEEILKIMGEAIEYVKNNPRADNVLISGGDALLNSNKVIRLYLEGLTSIPHVKFIRFGSRTPVVLPQRISGDPELLEILSHYGKLKKIYLVTQFNHTREFTKEAIATLNLLQKAEIPILNQTVLLKGVNDDADELTNLFHLFAENGISPYYLFQCRPVKGVKGHFCVPLLEGCELVDRVRANLSGIAKRFRFAMSHVRGKIEILGKLGEDRVLFKQHQAKHRKDANRIFPSRCQKATCGSTRNFRAAYSEFT